MAEMMKKVLLVDDSKLLLRLEQAMLAERYEVITALTAREAVERALSDRPDLVLSDLNLGAENGLQLREALARNERTRSIKVVLVTTASCMSRIDPSIERLEKPFDRDALLDKIEGCLGRTTPISRHAQVA